MRPTNLQMSTNEVGLGYFMWFNSPPAPLRSQIFIILSSEETRLINLEVVIQMACHVCLSLESRRKKMSEVMHSG